MGNTIRTKRLNAVHRYRITCDALLNDAAESGLFDTYVDLGAHHGEQVLQMGKRLSVLAFEPDPRAFEWLTKSVIANRESLRDDIQLLPLGVSNSSGVAKLNFSEASPLKTGGSTIEKSKSGYGNGEGVQVETIDILDVIEMVPDPRRAIFKFDIEGTEYRVLRKLAKHNRLDDLGLVLVEFHERKMRFGLVRGCWLTLTIWLSGSRRSSILEWY